jgi:hypothetical protein
MKNYSHAVIFAFLAILLSASLPSFAMASTFVEVAYEYNSTNNGRNGDYPKGPDTVLGGVPFDIPFDMNTWDSNTGGGLRSLSIPLSIYGTTAIHTLINNSWGPYGAVNTWMTFTGSNGASYTKYFMDGVDSRDWYHGGFANSINGTTTVCVYDNGRSCVDKQMIELPSEFADQYLTNISVYDNGGEYYHRAFMFGLTAETTGATAPEPVSAALFGIGLVSIAAARRAKRSK